MSSIKVTISMEEKLHKQIKNLAASQFTNVSNILRSGAIFLLNNKQPSDGIWRISDGGTTWRMIRNPDKIRISLERYRDIIRETIADKMSSGRQYGADEITSDILDKIAEYENSVVKRNIKS